MSARVPTLAESKPEPGRYGARPAMGEESVVGKHAKYRDYLRGASKEQLDRGGFIETIAMSDMPDDEYEALQQFIPRDSEAVSWHENINWLSDIAQRNDKAGMAAKRLLGDMRFYLGDEEMYPE